MQDLEKMAQELRRRGKTEGIRALADSADGRKLGSMIDGEAAQRALRSGDSAALQQLLRGVLGTDEGRRLVTELQSLMEK
jgi:hypothetical protein